MSFDPTTDQGSAQAIVQHDSEGRLIYRKDRLTETRYDSDGNIVYCKSLKDGNEVWVEYKNGRETHFKCSDGYEEWHEYEDGVLVYSWDSDGRYIWYRSNIICHKDKEGETWMQCSPKGMGLIVTQFKSADGKTESWHDGQGNQIFPPDPRCRNLRALLV